MSGTPALHVATSPLAASDAMASQRATAIFETMALETHALLLDVDGTLLDLAPRPDAVHVPGPLRATLETLHRRCGGALALVSGRTLAVLDALFAPLVLPAAGGHGAQLRPDPEGPAVLAPDLPPVVAGRLTALAARFPGVLVEDKGSSLAIHYRACPAHKRELSTAIADALRASGAAAGELEILPGHFVFEVRRQGRDKGTAVATLMAAPPFLGRVPVFIGDDMTDEAAFRAVQAQGGHALSVGRARGGADAVIPDPASVRAHLAQLAARPPKAGSATRQTPRRIDMSG